MRLNEHQRRDLWFCGIVSTLAFLLGLAVGLAIGGAL